MEETMDNSKFQFLFLLYLTTQPSIYCLQSKMLEQDTITHHNSVEPPLMDNEIKPLQSDCQSCHNYVTPQALRFNLTRTDTPPKGTLDCGAICVRLWKSRLYRLLCSTIQWKTKICDVARPQSDLIYLLWRYNFGDGASIHEYVSE